MPEDSGSPRRQRLRRTLFNALLVVAMVMAGGCQTVRVTDAFAESVMANLPAQGAAHMVLFKTYSGWARLVEGKLRYEIRSVAPGPPAVCAADAMVRRVGRQGRITVRNCSSASPEFVQTLADDLRWTVRVVERRFDNQVNLDAVQVTLLDTAAGYDEVYEQPARAMHLSYVVTESFDPEDPAYSHRSSITTTAHELFHLAYGVLGRGDGHESDRPSLDEEQRASFFAICVEHDVFGNISPKRMGYELIDPVLVRGNHTLRHSVGGGIAAARRFQSIAGDDHTLSDESERAEFSRQCQQLVR